MFATHEIDSWHEKKTAEEKAYERHWEEVKKTQKKQKLHTNSYGEKENN